MFNHKRGTTEICLGADGFMRVFLDNQSQQQLLEQLGYFSYVAADENTHISRAASAIVSVLPTWVTEALRSVATGRSGIAGVIIDNLPFESVDWSPVPGAPAHSAKETSLSEHLLLGMSSLFGEAYGVLAEGERLVNDLIPTNSDQDKLTGNGSLLDLGLHTENAALRFMRAGIDLSPKGLLLMGVSNQWVGHPVTSVASAANALRLMDPAEVKLLREPCAYINLPERQRHDGSEVVGPVPVVMGSLGMEEVIVSFYGDMMIPAFHEASVALEHLKSALESVSTGLVIKPGSMVYLANGRAVHGRSAFDPIIDRQGRAQRWVQRVFVSGKLDAFSRYQRINDRVFDLSTIIE